MKTTIGQIEIVEEDGTNRALVRAKEGAELRLTAAVENNAGLPELLAQAAWNLVMDMATGHRQMHEWGDRLRDEIVGLSDARDEDA